MKILLTRFLFLPFLFCIIEIAPAQSWSEYSFNAIDKDDDRKISFQELKTETFFEFDRNQNGNLSRWEFWRLKLYHKKSNRRIKKERKNGVYIEYYEYALEPLITYESPIEHFLELNH